ncbi:hypothetical protein GCM10007916_06560 [Psychromonas marina]|uniref:DUF541 domain-containing protein n=1 Tax=Psychromonas marina TaxID=88364 RepID=A0ABQ6DX57_9GAMM|nr:SIMPL domain-containing protein [Psychromonas marina]GLS89589.1 hypothetical protein GCM10007916_06560 [Psychromonas marina]
MRYLLLFTLSLFSFSTLANAFPDDPYVVVTGNASLEVKADQVIIEFQPSAVNKSGELAKQQVDQKIAVALTNLKQAGFDINLVESISQSTRPEYEYQKNKRVLLGVKVTHQLRYRLTEIDQTNKFLDALLNAQVEAISPLRYGLQDTQQWQALVRKAAVLDSKQKAGDLAQLYDAKLGKIYSVNYQSNHPQPVLMRAMAMESDAVAIKPKNITLNDRVESVFLLKP